MQFSSENDSVFKLTWKIHNFTMIPYKTGEPLWSPTIVIDIFAGTEWNIGLYVRGAKNENDITGIIYRGKSEQEAETIPVSLAISFRNADGSSTLICEKNYDFDCDKGYGFQLIPKSEVFEKKKYLYPGDTLIMECLMMKCNAESSLPSTLRNYAFDSKFETKKALDGMKKAFIPKASKCLIRTRINVEELRFVWAIPRFCSVKLNQKLTISACFAGRNSPKFKLSIIPNASEKQPEESMQIELSAESERSFYCLYEILLVDSDFVSRIQMKGEHLFEIGTSMSHNVTNSLKWSELNRDKDLRLVNETLTLYYKFEIASSSSVKSFVEQTAYFPPKFGVYSLKRNGDGDETTNDPIVEHNKDRKFCDVSLQVDGKLLRTHKIILSNWSPVFKTILEQDLSEDCNVLDIDGMDAETVDRMLLFMYTQTVEDLDWKETAKLYLAADKYKINSLLENCSKSLDSKISVLNACDLLFLADMHANEALIKAAKDFIKTHKDEVLRTEEWKKFMTDKGALAAILMHEMFVKD